VWQFGRIWRCDVRAADQTNIEALVGVSCLHGCQLLYLHDVGNRSSSHVGGGARTMCLGPRASRGRTCRARRRLVVRGGDLSCEAETCRGGPSSGELVGDAANWPETGRLAVWVLTRLFSPPCPESLP
jgi:hypothetical protein